MWDNPLTYGITHDMIRPSKGQGHKAKGPSPIDNKYIDNLIDFVPLCVL